MNDYKDLANEDIKKYRVELVRDQDKKFDTEFIRTTDLEAFLLKEYGFDGVKLVFSKSNGENYYQLGEFPQESPWYYLNGKKKGEAINTVFKSISRKIPDLISEMKERIRFIYSEKTDTEWRLHYLLDMKLYDGRDYFQVYTGGPPNGRASANNTLLKYNWKIPADLVKFYSIHDGFGGIDSKFILSSKQLTVMGEMMNPITKEQDVYPIDYKFDDLLEFFPDGAGNAQCFLRAGGNIDTTVDWDHEVWEISEEIDFYNFIDECLSEIDEE